MNEYIISQNTKYATLTGTTVQWASFASASVFKSKDRAEKVAKRFGGTVEPFYGKLAMGTKSTVTPKQSSVNSKSAYRSI